MNIEKFEQQDIAKQSKIIEAGITEFSKKSYSDASTDKIIQSAGISKGLLFYYFESKKNFYIYCLSQALERIIEPTNIVEGDFYHILFSTMNQKMQLCQQYSLETRFVNMASRETAHDVSQSKTDLFAKYMLQTKKTSSDTMERAISSLSLKFTDFRKTKEGLLMYVNTLMSHYLRIYQDNPDAFFDDAKQIQLELKSYIDLMLYGIIKTGGK